MNTADYIIKKIEEIGVNDIFGYSGDYNLDIIKAIDNNSQTRFIHCTNPLNAGYASDGYARIRGYGAFITNYGNGELTAINAVAGAFAENVPIINVVGLPSTVDINNKKCLRHNFQEVNYSTFMNAYKEVTSTVAFLTKDNAKIEIDRVFKTLARKKQPIYIALPLDIANMEISDRYVSSDWFSNKETLEELVNKISEKINSAKNPVILGDILVKRFDAEIEYKELVTKSNIPTTNFIMGTNLADMDLPNYIGGYFADLKNSIAENLVHNSDCLIAVGAIYSNINSSGMKIPYDINSHIAIYGDYTYVNGKKYDDVKMSEVLEGILEKIEVKTYDINKPNLGYKQKNAEKNDLYPEYVYPRLQEFFKQNDIVISETGSSLFKLAQMKFLPSIDFQSQTLWGAIGWSGPAALGASLAKEQARVILITGDGAHAQTAMEIGTILKYNLKPIVIVINNHCFCEEKLINNSLDNSFFNTLQINYSKLARVFEGDVWSTKVITDDDLDKALKVTQIMNKMCYIEVCMKNSDIPNITKLPEIKAEPEHNKVLDTEAQQESKPINIKQDKILYETVVHKSLGDE